jgi:lipoyl(octanoyl) transferase
LSHFEGVLACGIREARYGVTSLADLGLHVSLTDVDVVLRHVFADVFGPSELRLPERMD